MTSTKTNGNVNNFRVNKLPRQNAGCERSKNRKSRKKLSETLECGFRHCLSLRGILPTSFGNFPTNDSRAVLISHRAERTAMLMELRWSAQAWDLPSLSPCWSFQASVTRAFSLLRSNNFARSADAPAARLHQHHVKLRQISLSRAVLDKFNSICIHNSIVLRIISKAPVRFKGAEVVKLVWSVDAAVVRFTIY